MPCSKNVHKQLEKFLDYGETGDKFRVGASTVCEKVNTAGTDENLFSLVSLLGQGARVLPLELAPALGHGAQICARAPTTGLGQARAPSLNGA